MKETSGSCPQTVVIESCNAGSRILSTFDDTEELLDPGTDSGDRICLWDSADFENPESIAAVDGSREFFLGAAEESW